MTDEFEEKSARDDQLEESHFMWNCECDAQEVTITVADHGGPLAEPPVLTLVTDSATRVILGMRVTND